MSARSALLLVLVLMGGVMPLYAQSESALVTEAVEVVDGVGVFGQPIQIVQGMLTNTGDSAYTNVSLIAQGFDRQDVQVAEGLGVLVNACGAGLLFDFALQPGESRPFAAPLELFEADAAVQRLDVSATGDPTAPAPPDAELPEGIESISDREVVAVEWEDADTLRYAIGCERSLFTEWEWRRYDLASGEDTLILHPSAGLVDDVLRERLRLTDPAIFANSRLRFAPIGGERLVYQDRINDVYTAAADGRFQRRLHTLLNSYSLQGYLWLPENRFLAYYYGALGDPVLYFTADAEGRLISPGPLRSRPSDIVPGVSADGRRVILAGTFDEVSGYYITVVNENFFELMFEAEPPGNNYPPPVPLLNEQGNRVTQIYLIRPVDDEPRLQCFARPEEGDPTLYDLLPMPLSLSVDERAWSFISPDEQTLALSANGVNGGLWLIDLAGIDGCGERG